MAPIGQGGAPQQSLDVLASEARELFFEDIKEKRSARPKSRSISQKRPRVVVMPSDMIDKRSDAAYRAGEVSTYGYYDLERVLERMGLSQLPKWEELRAMGKEERKELFIGLVKQGLTSTQIAEKFGDGVTGKDVLNQLQSLEIRMSDIPGSSTYGTKFTARRKPRESMGGVRPMETVGARGKQASSGIFADGIGLSLMKKMTTAELSAKLLAVSSLFGDSSFANDGVLYDVQIIVRETDEKVPQAMRQHGGSDHRTNGNQAAMSLQR